MKLRIALLTMLLVGVWTMAAVAAGPAASPEGTITNIKHHEMPIPTNKLAIDPGDFMAGAIAGADYVRMMQADFYEDNAGNGPTDDDPDDAGWDWITQPFEHSTLASSKNLYGAVVQGVFQTYQFAPTPALFHVMEDAANHIVAEGPSEIRSAPDLTFLLDFATLSGIADPAYYIAGADAIWQRHLTTYGSATLFGEGLRDFRGVPYPNGIVAWDIGLWVTAVQRLSDISTGIYDDDADDIAEVIFQDSLGATPGYFDVYGANQNSIDDYSDIRYWWYTIGVAGLIDAFIAADVHTDELPGLHAVLLDCQYDWGAFSFQYGANPAFNDAGDQDTAYACLTLNKMDPTTENLEALNMGAYILSYWQDASGGQVYSSGDHYPEVGGECAAAMAVAWMSPLASVNGTFDGVDPVQCGDTKNITFNLDVNGGTPGVRGYELTLKVTGPVNAIVETDFDNEDPFDAFSNTYYNVVYDALNDYWIVNDAILGATGGLVDDADLVTLTLVANGDGPVDVEVISLKLRDPNNADIPAVFYGAGFTSDCTAPDAVDTFVGAPGHEKADLDWTMADISDVAGFEIWRSVWYDGDNTYDSAYPEYDDLPNDMEPTRPATRAAAFASGEWTLRHTAAAGDVDHTDVETVRGIYFYEIFAFDAAGNYGPPAADLVWVMNYWLGDVSDGVYTQFDGLVDVADISALGSYFGMSNMGLNHLGNHVDVGPTHDNSRLGIPQTDDAVDFEDLMIFAMNYDVVSATKNNSVPGGTAYLAWQQMENGDYVVRVTESNGLKGLRVRGDVNIIGVSAGSLVSEQDEMTFFANVGSKLDANIAVMGQELAFAGSGDLLVIKASGAIKFDDLTFEARGFDNSTMDISFEQTSSTIIPAVFELSSNYPNPFNPKTRISFSLPEAQAVTLTIYGVDGRKVKTLINEQREAGTHEVMWMGRDDSDQLVASGTYFYQINAGPYSQVRKMTLMK